MEHKNSISSQVVSVVLGDLEEILDAYVGHEVEELHRSFSPAYLHGTIFQYLQDVVLVEPVATVGDGLRDDARQGNVILGVPEEEMPSARVPNQLVNLSKSASNISHKLT